MGWRLPWSTGEELSLKNKVFKTLLVPQASLVHAKFGIFDLDCPFLTVGSLYQTKLVPCNTSQ